MTEPLMPKATAVWLVDNTALTFAQIAEFCGLHPFEVQTIADSESGSRYIGQDPVSLGQIALEEIKRCEKNPDAKLQLDAKAQQYIEAKRKKGARYTPVARRQDKPDAISWMLKHCPEASDAQISKLIGTTKSTIESIRSRAHWNSQNIRPRDPVLLGLCTQVELNKLLPKVVEKIADVDDIAS